MYVFSSSCQRWNDNDHLVVILVVFMLFFMVRPQRKEQQRKNEMMSTMEPGDTVLTSSGFYGTIIDIYRRHCNRRVR